MNEGAWRRLEDLARRAARDVGSLSPDELDELVRLHLRVSSQLAAVRARYGDAALSGRLSRLLAASSSVVHGTRARTVAVMAEAIRTTFPAAVWHARRAIAVATAVFLAGFVTTAVWLANSPAAYEAALPAAEREAYVAEDFEAYYSSEPGTAFAARVFTNNAGVGALAFGSGIAAGLPTLAVLLFNGVNVGVAAGLFHAAGEAGRFWALILPHGLLELTAVFVAGGAGLQLGWALVAPGERTRRASLAEEGRRSVVIVLGLVAVFLVAGLLEGYVTPAPWPSSLRVGVGAAVWLGFVAYVVVRGRRAARDGWTGAFGERRAVGQPARRQRPSALSSR
ncbi:MAG TPA: stage II sporulation protein M [Egicoccus sp.]|nr:stage II sporulation protein M [Egicoccus sp.]HSK24538.1 stage II sporulation protein M [Egicoccus sp.]